jgi:GNAT superfamily N-acetyltransferase
MDQAEVSFTTMTEPTQARQVIAMMGQLYAEDPFASPVDPGKFANTIDFLIANPPRGRIILISRPQALVGYAILIPYWSNEFAGTLLFVDELFITPDSRGQGIGHLFFQFLETEKPYQPIALALEVNPANTRAARFYQSLGFEPRRHKMLTRSL